MAHRRTPILRPAMCAKLQQFPGTKTCLRVLPSPHHQRCGWRRPRQWRPIRHGGACKILSLLDQPSRPPAPDRVQAPIRIGSIASVQVPIRQRDSDIAPMFFSAAGSIKPPPAAQVADRPHAHDPWRRFRKFPAVHVPSIPPRTIHHCPHCFSACHAAALSDSFRVTNI